MGRIFRNIILVLVGLFVTISSGGVKWAHADESDIFLSNLQPNVLIILGNNSGFDEDFVGNAICSWATGSRSVESRRQLLSLVSANASNMRIGLMDYSLPAVSYYYLHNSPYFVSYSDESYCPTPPAEPGCVDYCMNGEVFYASIGTTNKIACNTACQAGNANFDATYTGNEPVLALPIGNAIRNNYCPLIYPKTTRILNPTDGSDYVNYNLPGTDYAGSNQGTGFCYATTYSASPDSSAGDSYSCYHTKTGHNDDLNNYSNNFYNGGFVPTDEDIALGFKQFGRRNFWYYTGPTWFANSSPGGGYLVQPCAANPGNNSQLNALTAQLAMHENDPAGYMSCANHAHPNQCPYILNAGLTPTQGTLQSAINYFQGSTDYQSGVAYTTPIQAWCQNNFVILVTSGLQNTNPSGGTDTAANLEAGVVSQITALRTLTTPAVPGYTFNIYTYVLGMSITAQSVPLLNQMAQAGGTADSNGNAYYANNPAELAAALAAIPADIISRTYAFTVASVSSSRVSDENYIYQASFNPVNSDPFWRGYLTQYNLNADGTIGTANWEAGSLLAGQSYTTRNIYTSSNGNLITFDNSISPTRFNVADGAARNAVVGYVQGNPTYNPDNWKLGDIFHANPINVGTPSPFFEDLVDQNYAYTCNSVVGNAFDKYRCDNPRTSANGLRLILAGANDGQFHAFQTSSGSELWSFVPPNLLPQLQNLAHTTNPSALTHQYLVDGPVTVADVWWYNTGGTVDGTNKVNSDWHTLAIFGEGEGGDHSNMWSSDPQCDTNFQDTADSTHKYYCGYYAFDLTNTGAQPTSFIWHLGGLSGVVSAAYRPYLGFPWSKMMVGRVRYQSGGQTYEKWVGFIGGGYNGTSCTAGNVCGGTCGDCRGKGFYVIDLSNGQILWSYNLGNDANMQYSIPAAPAIVDTDQDGYIDTVYVGDTGGNMWRFKFCRAADMPNCGITGQTVNWSGGLLYSRTSTDQPIFYTATVAMDNQQNMWVFWGTGNKQSPKDTTSSGTLYAVKDDDRTTTYTIGSLKNISTAGLTYNTGDAQDGYYINMSGTGEKILSDPTVFGGVLYFTSYIPPTGSGDLCLQSGTASLYALSYTSGNGAFGGSARTMSLGAGIASSPMLSMKPGGSNIGDIYVTVSGGGGFSAITERVNFNPPGLSSTVNILQWRDRRIQ